MVQLKQLTILLQINTNVWILCGKIPYMDRSLSQKKKRKCFPEH